MSSAEQAAKHLIFLGYTPAEDRPFYLRHERYPNIRLADKAQGVLVTGWFGAEGDHADLVSYTNELNQRAMLSRFVIDTDGDFAMEGWYAGPYDKSSFASFMDVWHNDWVSVVLPNEKTRALLK